MLKSTLHAQRVTNLIELGTIVLRMKFKVNVNSKYRMILFVLFTGYVQAYYFDEIKFSCDVADKVNCGQ